MTAEEIVVGAPVVELGPDRSTWSVQVTGPELPDRLWYSVPRQHTHLLTERADPALVALTIPALRLGTPLVVEGPVTTDLAFWHPEVQALYSAVGHGTPIQVHCTDSRPALANGPGVATGFSAGIDSYAVLADHHYATGIPNSQRVTHLLFNNVGSHGRGGRELWRRRFRRSNAIASKIGLPLIDVDSNLGDYSLSGTTYMATHTPLNASVAHLLSGGITNWLYASAYPYQQVKVRGTASSNAYVDTIALPWFSTAGLTLRSVGSRYRRVDKTALVSEIADAWESLDVCVNSQSEDQCSQCWKCQRTMATLEILGKLDRFSARFDLDSWEISRPSFFARVMTSRDPFMIEIRSLMRERRYRISSPAIHARVARNVMQSVPQIASRTLRQMTRRN